MADLSAKQRLFIEMYFICGLNATKAAKKAGFAGNAATLAVSGHRMLRNANVSAEIERRLKEAAMSADEVLFRLAEHARSDMDDFLDAQGHLNVLKARRASKLRLVKKFKETTEGTALELHDAQTALVRLGQAHRLFVERHELTGDNGKPIQIEDARNALIAKIAALSTAEALAAEPDAPAAGEGAGKPPA